MAPTCFYLLSAATQIEQELVNHSLEWLSEQAANPQARFLLEPASLLQECVALTGQNQVDVDKSDIRGEKHLVRFPNLTGQQMHHLKP